jgi:hypothetical protein
MSVLLLLPQSSSANTLVVGPGGYATINAAVQAAAPGDTILVHAGTYREQVDLSGKAVTVRPYGDGAVIVDGECQREYAIYIGSGSGMVMQDFTVKRTTAAGIFLEHASNVTVDGMTIQDFACQGADDVWRAGIASWYGGSDITITNNTIQFRTSGSPYSYNDGIWFKSNDSNPSGGGHYIAGNTIIGGWDGIGGEEEGSAHGTFDRDTVIENNTIRDCWDDGIQSEGGGQNVRIRDNDISGCGAGIAFAAPLSGPLYVENNYIHDLKMGDYGALYCYKVGNSSSATVYMTGNTCDVDSAAELDQGGADGIHQTNGGMFNIVSSGNVFHVSRYVFEIGEPRGTYDGDCMWSTDSGRFIKWSGGTRYDSLSQFQSGTGQETHGQETTNCGTPPSPTPTASPSRTPTPTPSPTPTASPSRTPTPSPTPTASPSRTPSPTPTASPSRTATPSPTPTASPSRTPTPSPTPSRTPSPTPTASPSRTPTPSPTPSRTPSPTPTASPSRTPTPTPSPGTGRDTDHDSFGMQDAAGQPWFRDDIERFLGTSPTTICSSKSVDAWPPDVTRDGRVDHRDLSRFNLRTYSRRLDLNADGRVNTLDLLMMWRFYNRRCSG